MAESNPLEKIFWSVALPGFGQFLNQKYVKGFVLITLELLINVGSNLNRCIMLSFHGDIQGAINATNFQWLMFYPCVYMYSIWDAYRDSTNTANFSFFPCVFAAFFATVGIMYSPKLRIYGLLLGPVWLPMLLCFVGLGFGYLLKTVVKQVIKT